MRKRTLFWPFTLIAAGILWVLINTAVIPVGNLWALTYYWPFLLIALGLGIILRTRWAFTGMVISFLVVAGAVAVVLFAPQLGWNSANTWSIGNFSNFGGNTGGRVSGSRNIVTQTKEVGDFTRVTVNYPANIIIQQGASVAVKVTADDNLLPQLSTQVIGGTLIIDNSESNWSNRVNPSRTVQVSITVKDLSEVDFTSAGSGTITGLQTNNLKVSISGAGSITFASLKVKSLDMSMSGAGSAKADGSADQLTIHISGVGSFDGKNLAAQSADISISGMGSATVRVTNTLDAAISGTGSINYYGDPTVHKNVSGLGSVHKAGD